MALFVVTGAVFWRPILGLIVVLALSGTRSRPVPPAEAVSHVAGTFIRWGIVGAVPEADPDRQSFANSVKGQVRVVNAVRYSSGIHGDGTDWYEVELSAGLADEMRASLARSPAVHKGTGFYSDDAAPSWWPSQWPADARFYSKDLDDLVLRDTGTRAWLMRVRT